jgi:hypothetical protein
MSAELKTIDKTTLPAELRVLPIFQVLGNQIRTITAKPEAKKTAASIFFWILVIGGSFWFFKNIDKLLEYAQKSVLFVVWSILFIVLLLLAPKIISLLHLVGKTLLFKGEKSFIRKNPIETLELLLEDAKDTLKRVKDKIKSVDGVRINMITDAESSKKEAEEKYSQIFRMTKEAGELDTKAVDLEKQGFKEKANALKREANEVRITATLRKQEGEASEMASRQYAQYANQFAKVLEVLKDNESAARIYVNALGSSITIIDKKLEATNKMRSATEGLSDVFNIKEGWRFKEAMDAATSAISQNIASIRSNLEFLDENRSVSIGTHATQQELETFITQVNAGRLQTLNIAEIADSSYELKPGEKVDKGFSLLD